MTKKNKASESEPGDKPRVSKCRTQQSAALASAVSTVEKATKPKSAAVAAEGTPLGAEVAKGASATNVAEEERKMPALPKYAAVPRAVFRAGGVEAQGVAADKMEEIEEEEDKKEEDKKEEDKKNEDQEEEEKAEEDSDNDSVSGDNEEEESVDEGSDYNPDSSSGHGTVHLADDIDNLPDDKKPSPKEKVSSPFDLPILPIAKTFLVKQGKKGKQGKKLPHGDDNSILLLSDEEDPPLTKKKKVLASIF
jgi:hypothetical protein